MARSNRFVTPRDYPLAPSPRAIRSNQTDHGRSLVFQARVSTINWHVIISHQLAHDRPGQAVFSVD
jgi:hypothetical protein